MKSLFFLISLCGSLLVFGQVNYKVQFPASTPVANPAPLLKVYGNQSNSNYEPYVAPTYTTPSAKQPEPDTKPAPVTYRVMGDKFSSTGKEVVTMMIEVSTGYSGIEIVKVKQYKLSTSEYWEKLSVPTTANSNKGSRLSESYNYKVYLAIGEVYFNF